MSPQYCTAFSKSKLLVMVLLHLLQLCLYLLLIKNIVYFILMEHFNISSITINFYLLSIRFHHDHIITSLVMVTIIGATVCVSLRPTLNGCPVDIRRPSSVCRHTGFHKLGRLPPCHGYFLKVFLP